MRPRVICREGVRSATLGTRPVNASHVAGGFAMPLLARMARLENSMSGSTRNGMPQYPAPPGAIKRLPSPMKVSANVRAGRVANGIGVMNFASAYNSSWDASTRSGAPPVAIAVARSETRVAGSFSIYETFLSVVSACAAAFRVSCIPARGSVPQTTTVPTVSAVLVLVYVAKTNRPMSAPRPKTPKRITLKREIFMEQ